MAQTRSDIRTKCFSEIRQLESQSDYSTAEMNLLIDEAIVYLCENIEGPRRIDVIPAVVGQADYDISAATLTYDTLKVRLVYFGDKTVSGSVKKLQGVTEEKLAGMKGGWLENPTQAQGRPLRYFKKDLKTLTIDPMPDSNSVPTAGTSIYLSRNYFPAAMSSDSASPDINPAYYDLIPLYTAYRCYGAKLLNAPRSAQYFSDLNARIKIERQMPDKETDEGYVWGFTQSEGLDDFEFQGIIP